MVAMTIITNSTPEPSAEPSTTFANSTINVSTLYHNYPDQTKLVPVLAFALVAICAILIAVLIVRVASCLGRQRSSRLTCCDYDEPQVGLSLAKALESSNPLKVYSGLRQANSIRADIQYLPLVSIDVLLPKKNSVDKNNSPHRPSATANNRQVTKANKSVPRRNTVERQSILDIDGRTPIVSSRL